MRAIEPVATMCGAMAAMIFKTRLIVPTALVIAVAGCASAAEEPAGLATEDGSAPSATAEQTGSATPEVGSPGSAPATAPNLGKLPPGLEFRDVPDASGDTGAALDAYLGLETEAWRSFLDAKPSPDLARYATARLVADVEASVKYQRDHNLFGGGRMVITPSIERVGNELVLVGACADLSEVTNIVDGVEGPPEEALESPTWVVEALVMVDQAAGGRWKVSEHRLEPKKC
jgi:hypothetical protein